MTAIETTDKRRQTIVDGLVDDETIQAVAEKVLDKFMSGDSEEVLNKTNVVKLLLKTKLSNKSMARVLSVVFNDNTTAGAVASLIKSIRSQVDLLDELMEDISKF